MRRDDLPALLSGTPIITQPFVPFPRTLGNELDEVAGVLSSDNWLHASATQRFEKQFAGYIGARHAVAVNTGGMALQMAIRALGIGPGDEVLMQVDACIADAFAVFNAGAVPIFADSDPETFMLNLDSAEATVGPRTKAIIAIHMWGRPENMDAVAEFARKHSLILIDDACLACGAEWRGKKVGTLGQVGIFSFGSMKPLQAGGGGAIVTNDDGLANALRASRAWGDAVDITGISDQTELAWNGRISDILSAVLLGQLAGYPAHLKTLQDGASKLEHLISGIPGIRIMDHDARITAQAHTQFLFKIDEQIVGFSQNTLATALEAEGIPTVWHSAFQPVTTLSFFESERWRTWAVGHTNPKRLAHNYSRPYPGADRSFYHTGMSIGRTVLCSGDEAIHQTAAAIKRICANSEALRAWESANP
ncbi:MAG: DegT/DnrJ/EryC1/StrS family aminotransferase [Candidatus Hydrogenedentes bacterium]|nr:DegT/DnrJ/EryC1/StrS family aminotransferase [Candidatus Hydrogenedentota bacterium]